MFMNLLIKNEIMLFEELQKKYENLGADDSEPDYIFQFVIAHAITKNPLKFDEPIEWELYKTEETNSVSKILSAQASKVYDVIQKFAESSDIDELKKYCWRISKVEFVKLSHNRGDIV